MHRYPVGYTLPVRAKRALRQQGCYETNLPATLVTALADHLLITAGALLAGYAWLECHPAVALLVQAPALILIVRSQRGLECLTHDGSHGNWVRRWPRLNDWLTNCLVAIPTASLVSDYRRSHEDHHGSFRGGDDPDWSRYEKLDIEGLPRADPARFLLGLFARLGAYVRGWWGAVGLRPRVLVLASLWHAGLWIAPLAILLGWRAAVVLWAAYWLAPFVCLLPVLRFIAESGKHVYRSGQSEFACTVSNLGPVHRLVFHPHGDGFHVLHHLVRIIPHHQMSRAHGILEELDPQGYGRSLVRTRIFQDPVRGS